MEVSEEIRCAAFGPMLLALLVACGEQEEIECPPGYFNAGGTCVEAWAPAERQAPTSEPAGVVELDLPESRKREIFTEVVRAEDRADRETEQRYPVTCVTEPVSSETMQRWGELNDELSERYRTEVLERHSLTAEQYRMISEEAHREGWPLPTMSDPCPLMGKRHQNLAPPRS